jgi:hypothetical protein
MSTQPARRIKVIGFALAALAAVSASAACPPDAIRIDAMPFIESTEFGKFKDNVLSVKIEVPADFRTRGYLASAWASSGKGAAREAVLSTNACDFGIRNALKNSLGTPARFFDAWTFAFLYKAGQATAQAVSFEPGKTYYINIRNRRSDGSSSCAYDDCPIAGGVPQ